MILTNFKIEDSFSALEVEGKHRDLHNNFCFKSLDYDVIDRRLSLQWMRRDAKWVEESNPVSLKLDFSSVSLFKAKNRDDDSPYTEDDCLSSLGFIGNDLLEEIEGFAYTEPSDGANHLNISFESGFAIKIAAGDVTCIEA